MNGITGTTNREYKMNPEIAKAALGFLQRVELKGNEAEALVMVQMTISQFLKPQEVSDAEHPTDDASNGDSETSH